MCFILGCKFCLYFVLRLLTLGLRQSNNLKTIAKLEKYKMYKIDTRRDKSRDFDLVTLTS
jgi:hypothetical protein